MQLIDDLADAKDDLSNGYETLVTEGYYKNFGYPSKITDEKLNKVLDQERLKLIYRTGQELFSKARKYVEKHDEDMLQLLIEIQNLNFSTLFEVNK